MLPNTIIVSLTERSYFKDGELIIANRRNGEAFVLDGQHRLWAFDPQWSNNVDLELVVSAFINLPDEFKALIFGTINGEQRKINPSLVYDLIPMLRTTDWVKFRDARAQELVEELNTRADSPWRDRIAMVGESNRIISQSSFIAALKKLMRPSHIFADEEDFFEAAIQVDLLLLYSGVLATAYPVKWDNKSYLLCKYVGVSATLNLLEAITTDLTHRGVTMTDETGLVLSEADLQPYIEKLRQFDFSAKAAKEEGKSYGGEGGVSELTRAFMSWCLNSSPTKCSIKA
ncbi:MAG: hypothetical protein DMF61_27035 [Blastocatellia bacterium AA13]|nr:MAG: hypothetical protein DMF61_27035 [Blastocatellia bacterium AA13]